MQYGYCGIPSVQWKLEYGNGYIGVGVYGKLNTMLIRTTTWTHPIWYGQPEWAKLKAWVDAIMCDSSLEHIPVSASFGVQLLEQYRWKPKDATPTEGQIINYNAPCLTSQKRRKGLRFHLACSLQGQGAILRSTFMDACPQAELFLEELSGIGVVGYWTHQSCSKTKALNDWETFATGARLSTGPPSPLPVWTQMSVGMNSLNRLTNSVLTITEVQYFPDQDPRDVSIISVEQTLATRAGVYNCPR